MTHAIRTPRGLLDLRALARWTRANARSRAEYNAHPIATGHRAVYFATCEHCAEAKEKK